MVSAVAPRGTARNSAALITIIAAVERPPRRPGKLPRPPGAITLLTPQRTPTHPRRILSSTVPPYKARPPIARPGGRSGPCGGAWCERVVEFLSPLAGRAETD